VDAAHRYQSRVHAAKVQQASHTSPVIPATPPPAVTQGQNPQRELNAADLDAKFDQMRLQRMKDLGFLGR
jgi:hypothetical protein